MRAVVGGDVVDSAGFANSQLISFSLGSQSYHIVCSLETCFSHTRRQEPSRSIERGLVSPRGFILSLVWLENLVFGSIWEVPYFSKSVSGTAG